MKTKKEIIVRIVIAFFALLLIFATVFALTACGNKEPPPDVTPPAEEEIVMPGVIQAVDCAECSAGLMKERKGPTEAPGEGWNIGAIKNGTYALYKDLESPPRKCEFVMREWVRA